MHDGVTKKEEEERKRPQDAEKSLIVQSVEERLSAVESAIQNLQAALQQRPSSTSIPVLPQQDELRGGKAPQEGHAFKTRQQQ